MKNLHALSVDQIADNICRNNIYGLTAKEAKVCALLAKECKNLAEVSQRMHLATKTMDDYSRNIRHKTATQSMYQAIVKTIFDEICD